MSSKDRDAGMTLTARRPVMLARVIWTDPFPDPVAAKGRDSGVEQPARHPAVVLGEER